MMNLEWAKKQHVEMMASDTPTYEFKYGDNVVHIYKRIPYKTIKKAAEEYAGLLIHHDEDTGRDYVLPYRGPIFNYILLKYFTDFDLTGVETMEDFEILYDIVEQSDLVGYIEQESEKIYTTRELGERIAEAAVKMNNDAGSITTKLSKWMESMPVNTDWAEELAKSKEINDTMINLIGDQKEKQGEKVPGRGKVVDLTSFAKRK